MEAPPTTSELRERPSAAALVLAVAVPAIFLHKDYQPSVAVGGIDVSLTDVAIVTVACVAFADGVRHGFPPLRPALPVWAPLVGFFALVLVSIGYARSLNSQYAIGSHVVSAGKFGEYALLTPASFVVLRRAVDRRALFWSVAGWSTFLTLIGVLQFLGLVDEFEGRRPGQREPSYIGIHDLGAFSGAALALAFAALLLRTRTVAAVLGGVAGAIGIAVAAAFDAVGGMLASAVLVWVLARRRMPVGVARTVALAVVCAVVAVTAASLRSSAIDALLRFVGVRPESTETESNIQTYAHRTLLGYIGFKIWLDHPVLGVGWQGSAEEAAYGPHLAEARARFPDEPAQAFPSPQHPWGVQNAVLQALADLGIVGLVLLAAIVGATLLLVARTAARGPPQLGGEALVVAAWVVFAVAVLTGTGLLPGLPVAALLWLAVGTSLALHHSLTTRQ